MDRTTMKQEAHTFQGWEHVTRMKGLLKASGRIAIIEYKPGGSFSFRRLFGHFIPKEDLIREMSEAGYGQCQDFDILPEQSFLIFGT